MSPAQHSELPPSSAGRRMQCPGSKGLEEKYPAPADSPKSLEGTLAHAVCVAVRNGTPVPAGATEEMLEGADMWCDMLGREAWQIEHAVPGLHEKNWGTPDAWRFDNDTSVLHVADYKFGHRHVEAFENWQLLNYAGGMAGKINVPVRVLSLCVVQPRSYHSDGPARWWNISLENAKPYFERIAQNCIDSLQPNAPTTTGRECRDCSARHACTTLQDAAMDACDQAGNNVPFDLSPRALGRQLQTMRCAADLLAARVSGLENEVLAKIKGGVSIPGWRTEQGAGREKWAKPIDEVVALGQMMGIDVSKPGAITPKQAIKRGLPEEVVRAYSETPAGEIKLVEMGNEMAKIFGSNT